MRGEGSVRWSVRNPLEIPTKGGKSLPACSTVLLVFMSICLLAFVFISIRLSLLVFISIFYL